MNPAERQLERPMLEEGQTGDRDRNEPNEPAPIVLPEIPIDDLSFDLSSVIGVPSPEQEKSEKIQKRASNVMKLAQENEKLKAELKALTDRLEAAEGKLMEHPRDTHDTTLKHP